MPLYQIALTVTIRAEDENEARQYASMFLSAALTGEPGPVEDYSIEETMEEYDDDGTIHLRGDK